LGSHLELRYLKERREIFLKIIERCELLAAVYDLTVQVMPSNGGKSRTFHRQELPDKKEQNKDEKLWFCLVAFS
jgi:hypothetical protein